MLKEIYIYILERVWTIDKKRINKRLVEVGQQSSQTESFTRHHDCFAGYFIIEDLPTIHIVYNLAGECVGNCHDEETAENLFIKLLK